MADYAAAKKQIFTHDDKQVAVLNGDDAQARFWITEWSNKQRLWLYGRSELVHQHDKFVSCHSIVHHSKGVDFVLNTHLGDIEIHSPLLGDFNIDNLLAAIAVLLIEGLSLDTIAEKITQLKAIAGRMEAFSGQQTPTAVVDYAHTPDALEKALIACRQHCHGQLFVVFGCGGDRDKGKRPLMAQAAQKYADCLVVTNDNPRTEKPMSIIEDVLAGLNNKCQVNIIVDRKQAVLETLAKAKVNDVVLLAGKGHEDYIILGSEKIDYNERDVVKQFFDNEDGQTTTGEKT
jgi:UDP-N-acetylmuramoyl-L-alanyl-D-glutamate--2,6-diaminopimelate ligase